jgi:hypothetical protein
VTPHLGHKDPLYKRYSPENYDIITKTYIAGFINRLRKKTGEDKIILE